MHPLLVNLTIPWLGVIPIHTYGFLIAEGFLVALWFAVRRAGRDGVPSEKAVDIGFYGLLAAIIGSRVFYIATNWSYYAGRPLDILKIWEGGLVFYGGVLFAVPTAVW